MDPRDKYLFLLWECEKSFSWWPTFYKRIEMVCCKEKEGKDYLDHKHTPEKIPSLKNKYVCTKRLSASGSFWGLQSFEWFSFTIKGIQRNYTLLYWKTILSKLADPNCSDAFALRHLSFPIWQMSKSKVCTGRKKRESGVEPTLNQICQTISQLDIVLIQCVGVKRKRELRQGDKDTIEIKRDSIKCSNFWIQWLCFFFFHCSKISSFPYWNKYTVHSSNVLVSVLITWSHVCLGTN